MIKKPKKYFKFQFQHKIQQKDMNKNVIFKTGSKHYQNIFKRFAAKPVRTQNMLNKLKDNFIF